MSVSHAVNDPTKNDLIFAGKVNIAYCVFSQVDCENKHAYPMFNTRP